MLKYARSLGARPSLAERKSLIERRDRLSSRISAWEKRSTIYVAGENIKWRSIRSTTIRRADVPEEDSEGGEEEDEVEVERGEFRDDSTRPPEVWPLRFPSLLAAGEGDRLSLRRLRAQEAALRKGQVNDALEGLRMALGEKSLRFRTDVRNARSQRTKLKSWDQVNKQDALAKKHKRAYDRARSALLHLDVDREYLETLRDITPQDMKMSGDVIEENRVGQRSEELAWFWRLSGSPAADEINHSPRLKECKWARL